MSRCARNLREIASTLRDFISLSYPGFVYGESGLGAIPVFCLHGVESESLGAMLAFLDANGYATLDADEYYDILTGRVGKPEKAIVLTFDDGWRSLWFAGLPLLKRYGTKGVVFILPGRVRAATESPLLSWEEISEIHASGLVDFQSHSLTHGLVCRSAKIADFVRPEIMTESNYLNLPHRSEGGIGVRYGEPMYASAPRLSDTPEMLVDHRIADACAEFVARHGGPDFFSDSRWRTMLRRLAASEAAKLNGDQRRETPGEQLAAIRREMVESKRLIEEMLPGKEVRHFCYPWHVAGEIARAESRKAGYLTNFLGRVGGRYFNPVPHDPYGIARLGGDFFFRLPGKGRIPLLSIWWRKAVRRAREGHPYLTR